MKYREIVFLLILITGCGTNQEKNYRDASLPAEKRARLLLSEMTLEEKVGQMCQYTGTASLEDQPLDPNADEQVRYVLQLGEKARLIREGKIGSFLKVPGYKEANYLQQLAEESRLKIPLLIATDAIHGHGMYVPPATIFPTPIGMAASFDEDVARTVAEYTAREMRATGYHWTFSPNVEIVRDARWGRFGETFGEDPLLVSRMGRAMIRGYQGENFSEPDHVIACAKHFVAGGIAFNGLNGAPAEVSRRTLSDVFFPPFQEAIAAGVYTIMPAHNDLNGIPCHAHREYLTGMIRDQWGFDGFFISDWMDIERLHEVHYIVKDHKEAAQVAVNAGLDMHMHGPDFFENVVALVREGKIPEERIDEAVLKILTAKFQVGLFEDHYVDSVKASQVVLCREHIDYALEAACKSIVLLKNEDKLLPVKNDPASLFLTGPLADHQGILGDWSRLLPEEYLVSIREGIAGSLKPSTKLDYMPCGEIEQISAQFIAEAVLRAGRTKMAILVLGENPIRFSPYKTIGENLDRHSLDLSGLQTDLARAVINTGVPTLIILVNGGPIASEWLYEHATAVIEAWEPGMMGGQAVADVIFGKYNPGGRLPVTIPRSIAHIQSFYNYKPSSFHRGKFKGVSISPLYEFGYGLSYTEFSYDNLEVPDNVPIDADIPVSFTIRNSGELAGDEVVLLFIRDKISRITTPVRKLVDFQRIHLDKGEAETLQFIIPNEALSFFNENMEKEVESGEFELIIGLDRLRKDFRLYTD